MPYLCIRIFNDTDMNTLQRIGKVTKNMRVARGLSQEQFCAQCGIDQHYISNIENGQRNISIDVVERISGFFGLSLSQFFAVVETLCENPVNYGMVREDEPHQKSGLVSAEAMESSYTRWMKQQGLSDRTVKSYSSNTANNIDVQNIINGVAGTLNMYNVTKRQQLDRIIERIKRSEFDQTGHSMYSAGLKKWREYLIVTGRIS